VLELRTGHGGAGEVTTTTGGLPAQSPAGYPHAWPCIAILVWRRSRRIAIPEPSPELLVTMLSCAMAEAIAPDMGPMTAAQLGLTKHRSRVAQTTTCRMAFPCWFYRAPVVSGLCAAYCLQRARDPFVALEESARSYCGTLAGESLSGAGSTNPQSLLLFLLRTTDWSMYFGAA